MLLNRDKVEAIHGSWGSGLCSVEFESGRSVYGDNGPTVRAFDSATGGAVIGEGHTINNDGIKGLDICWFEDEFGLTLGGFVLTAEHPELEAIPMGGSAEVTDDGDGLKIEVV